jgi:hypothetical protein
MQSTPNNWARHTVVILGSGPSLTDEQVEYVRECENSRVITLNNTYARAPWADVHYAGDYLWWKIHRPQMLAMKCRGAHWTQDNGAAERFGINRVKGANREGLGLDIVHTGGNSGYQAINLAYLWGARKIVLLGFDMKAADDGRRHWHPEHKAPLPEKQLFTEWIHRFKKLAADLAARGVVVINCTPDSALPWFPHVPLKDTICPPLLKSTSAPIPTTEPTPSAPA